MARVPEVEIDRIKREVSVQPRGVQRVHAQDFVHMLGAGIARGVEALAQLALGRRLLDHSYPGHGAKAIRLVTGVATGPRSRADPSRPDRE